MKSKDKNLVLLQALLKSTSLANTYKYTTDKKKKHKIIGNYIALTILYVCLAAYCILSCVGYGFMGLQDSIPVLCALTISMLSFLFTFFKTNGYLFNFKEYDMLMSLPFETKTIVADKFLYMYIKSLPMYMSISVAMMIGYGVFAKPFFVSYILWIILSLVLPIIPMLLAAFIGFFIAKVSSGFKKNNIVQTILTFIFIIFCFSLRFIIDAMVRNNQVEETLDALAKKTAEIADIYLPAGWFSGAIVNNSISDVLLLIGLSILLFEVIFIPVAKSYRKINSALKSHAASKQYKMDAQRKKSLVNSIAFKEFKRLTGSTTYLVNGAMGEVLTIVLSVVVLFVGMDKVIFTVTQGAPISAEVIFPAIPLVIYFFIGMVATTACSPSLEGKNFWIVKSLPIDMRVLYKGKMLFNMYLTVPFMTMGIVCICISAGVPFGEAVLYVIEGIVLCAFSTAWGCACGIKHIKLEWENEVEVIKQGSAVAAYLLPNMFVTMGLIVLVVFLGTLMANFLITIILTLIVLLLAALSYIRAMKLADKQ